MDLAFWSGLPTGFYPTLALPFILADFMVSERPSVITNSFKVGSIYS